MPRMVEVEWRNGRKAIKYNGILRREKNKTLLEILKNKPVEHRFVIRDYQAKGMKGAQARECEISAKDLSLVLEIQAMGSGPFHHIRQEDGFFDGPGMNTHDSTDTFLMQDCDHVYQQNVERDRCNMQIFLATIAAVVTSGFALIGLVKRFGGLQESRPWLMFGMAIPIGVLTIAIFVSIQKQRTKNLYEGLSAALRDHYHRDANRMRYFLGWLNATRVFNRCKNDWSRMPNGCCKRQNSCIESALQGAITEMKGLPLMPFSFLATFSGFAAVVYSLLYVVLALLLIRSADFRYGILGEPRVSAALILATLIILVSLLAVWGADAQTSKTRTHSWARWLRAVDFVSFAFAVIFSIAWIVLRILLVDLTHPWLKTLLFTGLLFTIIYIGMRLFRQAYHLRKGRHSFEAYRRMWDISIRCCPRMFHEPKTQTLEKPT